MLKQNVVCWTTGDKCHGCDHYHGKADRCTYAPDSSPTETRSPMHQAIDLASISFQMPGYIDGKRVLGADAFLTTLRQLGFDIVEKEKL